ncbi:MAG: T9SS type A sorting domain-containing protein, partial [Bacteroidota bacterium]
YYRLRQMDQDASFSLSQQVELQLSADRPMMLLAMPVPADTELSLQYLVPSQTPTQLQIVSALGQVMMRQTFREASGQLQISVVDWPSGIYYAQLMGERQKVIYKISVQH